MYEKYSDRGRSDLSVFNLSYSFSFISGNFWNVFCLYVPIPLAALPSYLLVAWNSVIATHYLYSHIPLTFLFPWTLISACVMVRWKAWPCSVQLGRASLMRLGRLWLVSSLWHWQFRNVTCCVMLWTWACASILWEIISSVLFLQ
jgi:hypothetical protein